MFMLESSSIHQEYSAIFFCCVGDAVRGVRGASRLQLLFYKDNKDEAGPTPALRLNCFRF